jgi:transposase
MQQEVEQPVDVTEVLWRRLRKALEGKRGGRPATPERRLILEAIVHVMRTECGWEHLPEHYPPWKTVHWHYTKWRKSGIWEAIWVGLSEPSPPQ